MNLDDVIRESPINVVEGEFAVLRVPLDARVAASVFAIIRDYDEQTVILPIEEVKELFVLALRKPFRLLCLNVLLPFEAPGFLATACRALASSNVSVLVISTFSKDYLLISSDRLEDALRSLIAVGFRVGGSTAAS